MVDNQYHRRDLVLPKCFLVEGAIFVLPLGTCNLAQFGALYLGFTFDWAHF